MNYSWQILKLGTVDQTNNQGELLENSVVYVHWRKIATDSEGNSASYLSESRFDASSVPLADFVNLNDLTKEIVVSWIENSLSATDTKMINNVLATKIEKNKMKTFNPNWG